ncbi:MAG: PEP-CTERM sorting domain-containing protein [Phycisphaerales bacterium]|nr:PEP-CTERM sorting domain-containing protein [Phycisphaerales bacterium]
MRQIWDVCCAAGVGSLLAFTAPGQVTLTGLGVLPGGSSSSAAGVTADGNTIVGTSASTFGQEMFRWTQASGIARVGAVPTGPVMQDCVGVSADGSVIAGTIGGEAVRWTAATGFAGLGFFPFGSSSAALAISRDGDWVVGTSMGIPETQGFWWNHSLRIQPMGTSCGTYISSPRAVTDTGVVVGKDYCSDEAFRWTLSSGMVGLGYLGVNRSIAYDVSDDGAVVVGSSSTTELARLEAFRWTAQTGMVGLGDLPGGPFNSEATAISGDGRIITGFGTSVFGQEPFIWDARRGMRNLVDWLLARGVASATQWLVVTPSAVSHDGSVIVGTARYFGVNQAWVLRIGTLCDADLTDDGTIDFTDYLEFLNLFDAADPRADYTGDGVLDFPDYLEFLNHYDAGC